MRLVAQLKSQRNAAIHLALLLPARLIHRSDSRTLQLATGFLRMAAEIRTVSDTDGRGGDYAASEPMFFGDPQLRECSHIVEAQQDLRIARQAAAQMLP